MPLPVICSVWGPDITFACCSCLDAAQTMSAMSLSLACFVPIATVLAGWCESATHPCLSCVLLSGGDVSEGDLLQCRLSAKWSNPQSRQRHGSRKMNGCSVSISIVRSHSCCCSGLVLLSLHVMLRGCQECHLNISSRHAQDRLLSLHGCSHAQGVVCRPATCI